jgi:hypothetical protein
MQKKEKQEINSMKFIVGKDSLPAETQYRQGNRLRFIPPCC